MASRDALPEPLERYYDAMGNSDFETAAEQFTEDCIYYHPPSFRDDPVIEGRSALFEYFSEERGEKDIDHAIQKVVRDGDSCGVVGHLTGADIDGEDYFVSYAELEDGKISYYMAGLLVGGA